MILGLGVDIVEVGRMARILKRYPKRFLERVFTQAERELILSRPESHLYAAAFFAAKEACSKALGTGLRGISWKEMEIGHHPTGKPFIVLKGRAQKRFQTMGGKSLHLSLSHERTHAVAVVIIEGEGL